jgi:hypothetical protein
MLDFLIEDKTMTNPTELINLITNTGAKAVEISQSAFNISEELNMRDLSGNKIPLGSYTQLRMDILIPITVHQP